MDLFKLPGHPVRTGQARRGRSAELSALSMSKGFPAKKYLSYCAPFNPAQSAGLAGHIPVTGVDGEI